MCLCHEWWRVGVDSGTTEIHRHKLAHSNITSITIRTPNTYTVRAHASPFHALVKDGGDRNGQEEHRHDPGKPDHGIPLRGAGLACIRGLRSADCAGKG